MNIYYFSEQEKNMKVIFQTLLTAIQLCSFLTYSIASVKTVMSAGAKGNAYTVMNVKPSVKRGEKVL